MGPIIFEQFRYDFIRSCPGEPLPNRDEDITSFHKRTQSAARRRAKEPMEQDQATHGSIGKDEDLHTA
ncbi:hypothetical protein AC629_17115 [Bradyrhizobium sp. NAS80.1]|nr:hypothetical protein AC629_17115 [Bradyrhizobium sp. NAS80.1]